MRHSAYLSTFIGRKEEVGEITSLMRERSVRLLTLTGPGGCGKTRLAYEALSVISETFEDGTAWVDLAGLSTADDLLLETASALDIRPGPGQTLPAALTAALQQRETLLVLDNCEHLIDACAQMVDALLRACPELHFLATSRQKLSVEGEQAWPVPPLSYPEKDISSIKSMGDYDAVQLFMERSRLVDPGFEIDARNFSALVKVTRLLEGMPLAIELAAARVNELNVVELARRLEGQLSFMHNKGNTPVTRHRSMSETIHWSYELLTPAEKLLFCRLGVFRGGFSLEAVEAVCSEEPLAGEQILDLLGKLVDKSLVLRERGGRMDSHYRQLESIRQYAVEQLQARGEVRLLHDRHLAYFSKRARDAGPHLLGPHQKQWTGTLEGDYENLQASLSWSVSRTLEQEGFALEAAGMAADLYWFWNYSGRHEEARNWYAKILDLPGLDRRSSLYAHLQHHMATFVWLLGSYPDAEEYLNECIETAWLAEDPHILGHAKLMLGIMSLHQGQTGPAVLLLRESESLFSTRQAGRERVITYTNLSGVYRALGDLEPARVYAEKAVRNARASQDLWGLGLSLSGLGEVLYRQGEVERSFLLMEEALELLQSSGQPWLQAEAIWRIAVMLRHQGDLDHARKKFEQCYDLAQVSGAVEWQLSALNSLGFLSLGQGDQRQAAGHFSEILRTTGGQSYQHILVHAFLGVIRLAAASGQWRQAAALWQAYGSLKTAHGLSMDEEESATVELLQPHLEAAPSSRAQLSEDGTSLAEATGLAMEICQGFERRVMVVPAGPRLRILALGPTEVYLDGRMLVASDWTFAKPRELLFYLVSNASKTKEQIGLDFWPDASPGQLRVSLRATLYHVRRALGEREWILYEDGFYRFNRSMEYWYDVEAFEKSVVDNGKTEPDSKDGAIEKLEAAIALYRGDFAADLAGDEWAALRREELRRKYLGAMNTLGRLLAGRGVYDRAIEAYRKLLSLDNLVEDAHRELMRCYALKGEHGLAVRQYKTLVEILRDELGVSPSSETTALFRSLQQNTL